MICLGDTIVNYVIKIKIIKLLCFFLDFIINHANMSHYLSSSNINYFYFDDSNYDEPQAKKGLSIRLIILLVVIG